MKTTPVEVLLKSDLIAPEESRALAGRLARAARVSAVGILELDLPARNRVEALLRPEFFNEGRLRELACEFAAHTLHIFEEAAPGDYRPHDCLCAASLLNTWGIGSWEGLQRTIEEARPVTSRFRGEEHLGAFAACRAALLVGAEDAALMAREVAACSQTAAHRKEREERISHVEPAVARETEAAWQLTQIVERL